MRTEAVNHLDLGLICFQNTVRVSQSFNHAIQCALMFKYATHSNFNPQQLHTGLNWETDLIARRATLYARSASCGSKAEKRYLAKVCMGTLSLWMTSPRPLNGPAEPRVRQQSVMFIFILNHVKAKRDRRAIGYNASSYFHSLDVTIISTNKNGIDMKEISGLSSSNIKSLTYLHVLQVY